MARYTGPKHRLARREGINILDKTSASLQKRLNVPPGFHGRKRKRAPSEFGIQMREKQKAKALYGLMEKQFRRLVQRVQKKRGETGEMLIALLETRLDNIVYRLGFVKSRFQARQLVSHGHVFVNGKKLNIPSYQVKIDDEITLSEKIKKNAALIDKEETRHILGFLVRDDVLGRLVRFPKREDVNVPFDTQLIIEYYSR